VDSNGPFANYLRCLKRSGLLEEAKLTQLLSSYQKQFAKQPEHRQDPELLGQFLLEQQHITAWQHKQLIQGRHKGFQIGKYRLLRPLGAGGMGAVYLAEHTRMRRQVALKVLPTKLVNQSSYLERFLLEARAIASLDHPNIVQAYSVDNEGDLYYLVMQFVDGKDLHRLIHESGPLECKTAAEYVRQAAEGLAHAHQKNLIHRDIKPGNLLVDTAGTVKILDLGLALISKHGERSLTIEHDDGVIGTADFLAPEQALDSHRIDSRADIYSLGCTFYFLLTGRAPFCEGSVAQRLVKHQSEEPPDVRNFRPDAPPEMLAILRQMMAKRPTQRYQTAAHVARDLGRWLGRGSTESVSSADAHRSADDEGSSLSLLAAEQSQLNLDRAAREATPPPRPSPARATPARTTPPPQIAPAAPRVSSPPSVSSVPDMAIRPTNYRSGTRVRKKDANPLIWLGGGATALALIAGLAFYLYAGSSSGPQGYLQIDWPTNERQGAQLTIDGKRIALASTRVVPYSGPPGEVRVTISRRGYQPYERQITLRAHEKTTLRPAWFPLPGVPGAVASADPNQGFPPPQVATTPPATTNSPPNSTAPNSTTPRTGPGNPPPAIPAPTDPAPQNPDQNPPSLIPSGQLIPVNNPAWAGLWTTPTVSPRLLTDPRLPLDSLQAANVPPAGQALCRLAPVVGLWGDLTYAHWSPIVSLTASPDGNRLYSLSQDGNLKLWDIAKSQLLAEVPSPDVGSTLGFQVVCSPDGKFVATLELHVANPSSILKLYSSPDLQLKQRLDGNPNGWTCLAFASDAENTLWAGDSQGQLWSWAPQTRASRGPFPTGLQRALALAASPTDSSLAVTGLTQPLPANFMYGNLWQALPQACSPKVLLWNTTTSQAQKTWDAPLGNVTGLAFLRDGSQLIAAGLNGGLQTWNPQTDAASTLVQAHVGPVQSLAVSASGKLLATSGRDGTVRLWSLPDLQRAGDLPGRPFLASLNALSFFAKDSQLALNGIQEYRVGRLDLAAKTEQRFASGLDRPASDFVFSADEKRLQSVGGPQSHCAWDALNPSALPQTTPYSISNLVQRATLSPDGQLIAIAAVDGPSRIQLLETASGKTRGPLLSAQYAAPLTTGWSFSPNGQYFAAITFDASDGGHGVRIWNTADGSLLKAIPLMDQSMRGLCLAFSPDSQKLATAHLRPGTPPACYAQIYQTADGTPLAAWEPIGTPWFALAWSNSGSVLASGELSGALKFWHTTTKELLAQHASNLPITLVDFAPDGRRLAYADIFGQVTVMDLRASGCVLHGMYPVGRQRQIDLATLHTNSPALQQLRFTADGRHLAAGLTNGALAVLRLPVIP